MKYQERRPNGQRTWDIFCDLLTVVLCIKRNWCQCHKISVIWRILLENIVDELVWQWKFCKQTPTEKWFDLKAHSAHIILAKCTSQFVMYTFKKIPKHFTVNKKSAYRKIAYTIFIYYNQYLKQLQSQQMAFIIMLLIYTFYNMFS